MISAFSRKPRVGLALGGGAARGLAHLGVLQVLEENDLTPVALSGCSVGALIGAVWITRDDAYAAETWISDFVNSDAYRKEELEYLSKARQDAETWTAHVKSAFRRGLFLGRTYLNESFVSESDYRHNIEMLVPDTTFESLRLPFYANAVDLITGNEVLFHRGPLREALLASGAVPGLLPPRSFDGMMLTDGGVVAKIPLRPLLRQKVDLIIGVDVSKNFLEPPSLGRGTDIMNRAKECGEWNLRRTRNRIADVIVRPKVEDIHWLSFSAAMPAVQRGREAMEEAIDRVKECFERDRWRRLIGRSHAARAAALDREGWFGPAPREV